MIQLNSQLDYIENILKAARDLRPETSDNEKHVVISFFRIEEETNLSLKSVHAGVIFIGC